jgi:toxin ParE1/3/4
MKYEIVFLAEAESDLNNLFDYIADQSGAVRAQDYVGRIEAACAKLASFPNRGAPRDDLLPGLRTLSVGRWSSTGSKTIRCRSCACFIEAATTNGN